LSAAPDYVDPTVGWRCWLVAEIRGQPRLVSVVYHAVWEPGQELKAECLRWRPQLLRPWRRRPPDHGAPRGRCSCGVYAADSIERALVYLDPYLEHEPLRFPLLGRVLGRVSLWGRVVECERGWRGSHAYPEHIYVPTTGGDGKPVSHVEEIALGLTDYRVPVELVDGDDSYGALADALSLRLTGG